MTITQAFKKFGDKLKENILSISNKRSKDLNYSPTESSDISTKGYVDDIANKKTSLPTDDSGVVQHGTAGQVAVSDGSGGITWSDLLQPDWEQNDETALDYIKNKPETTADKAVELLFEVGMIDPVVDDNGSIYIEDDNVIYTL